MSEKLDKILEIRRKVRAFLTEAVEQGVLLESFALAAAIAKMVAAGGADVNSITNALATLKEIDADLDKAMEAAQATQ